MSGKDLKPNSYWLRDRNMETTDIKNCAETLSKQEKVLDIHNFVEKCRRTAQEKQNMENYFKKLKASKEYSNPSKVTLQDHRITKAMQLNKLTLDDNEEKKLFKSFKERMCHKNFFLHLTLSKIFCSSSKDTLIYMDSWFLIISETDDFLQLEVNLLEEILSRSSLLVTTEIEVNHVVNKWIKYDFIERGKFSKRLLHKIRFPLLGEKTLKKILTKKSCFRKNKDTRVVVNEILKGNFDFYRNKPSKFFTARYCGHDSFDILYFGGFDYISLDRDFVDDKIIQIQHSEDYKKHEVVSSLARKRYYSKAVYLRGNVYIFGGFDQLENFVKEVEIFSLFTKTCKVVAIIGEINGYEHSYFAVCGFTDKIYLLGGRDLLGNEIDLSLEFDTKDCSWKHKSKMIKRREGPAACVFEEKIIVSGGLKSADDNFVNFVNYWDNEGNQTLNTVEAYDPIDDSWTEFPTMNYSRCLHNSVVVQNKMFVIAGGTDINEVYDSTSKKFAVLKPKLRSFKFFVAYPNDPFAIFSVGNKLFTYFGFSSNIFCFDTIKGKWSEKSSKATKDLNSFAAIKVPRL